MKILFISSGYSGIYPYFEQSILDSLTLLNQTYLSIPPKYNRETIKQIEAFQPDVALVFVGYGLPNELIPYLKTKGIQLGIWLTEDPYYIDESIKLIEDFHMIFTIDLGAYEFYKNSFQSKKIYHLPLGTDPSLYHPLPNPRNTIYDLCLIGYPYPERIQLVQDILENTKYTVLIGGPLWRKLFLDHQSGRLHIFNKWIDPPYLTDLFHSAKIILNPHRAYDFYKNKNTLGITSKSINNRTFDIAACGVFQLLSEKADLATHFDTANEIISYSTNQECLQLIETYIDDAHSRTQYGHNARKRVIDHHTFVHRIQFILKQLRS
ncbi:CgeB family protein [Bacillus sp. JJ1764]|uniref:CgeB family protein n=1 Tax=Bacillus sp. JJ1764 TaxID=3122964 RepID=UPI002FFEF74E